MSFSLQYLITIWMIVHYVTAINLEYKGNNEQDLEQILKAVQKGEASIMGPFSSKQFSELAKRSSMTQSETNPQQPLAILKSALPQNLTTLKDSSNLTNSIPILTNNANNGAVSVVDVKLANIGSQEIKKRMQIEETAADTHLLEGQNKTVLTKEVKATDSKSGVNIMKKVDAKSEAKTIVESDFKKFQPTAELNYSSVADKSKTLNKSPLMAAAPEGVSKKTEATNNNAALTEKQETIKVAKETEVDTKAEEIALAKKLADDKPEKVDDGEPTKMESNLKKNEPQDNIINEEKTKPIKLAENPLEELNPKTKANSAFVVYDTKDKAQLDKKIPATDLLTEIEPNLNVSKSDSSQIPFTGLKPELTQLFAVNFKESPPIETEGKENSREKRQKAEESNELKAVLATSNTHNTEVKKTLEEPLKAQNGMTQGVKNSRLETVFAHNRQLLQNSPQLENPRAGTITANSLPQRRIPAPNYSLGNQLREADYRNRPNFYRNAPILRNNFAEGSSYSARSPPSSIYRQNQVARSLSFDGNKIIDVQVVCNLPNNQMIFTVQFQKQFFGVIYAKGYFKVEACRTIGKGSQSVSLVLPLDGCGSTTVSDSWDLTNSITSFQNKIIVMFDNDLGIMSAWDSAYKASCAMGGENGPKISSHITVPMLDSSKIAPTTMNMPPAFMKIVAGKIPTAPRASLLRLGEIGTVVITIQDNVGIFDLTVLNCMAHDGMNMGKIQLLDDKGCPVHNKIIGPQTRETFGKDMLIYAHFKVFKFPDVENVYFECNIKFCFHRCQQPQCGIYGVYSGSAAGRKKRSEIDEPMTISQMPNFINDKNNSYNLFQTIKVEIPESNQSPNIQPNQRGEEIEEEENTATNYVSSPVNSFPLSALTTKNFCLTKMAFGISLSVVASLFFGIASLLAYLYLQKMSDLKKCHAGDESCFVPYIDSGNSSSLPQSPLSHKSANNKQQHNNNGAKYDDFRKTLNSLFFQMYPVNSNPKSQN